MPTEKQITDANASVTKLHPNARIKSVGPNGVEFEYPDTPTTDPDGWRGKPFAA